MKQTAVEWLIDELQKEMIERDKFDDFEWIFEDLIKKSKEMEIQQMKIYTIDKNLFNKLPIEGTNFTSFNVNEFRYFATKYYIDNYKTK